MGNYTVVVLDFETTGLSPDYGDRVIEVGAVMIRDNRIVDRFESLMNPGVRVSSFIENYIGITNSMLSSAPSSADVMKEFSRFMAQHHLVAHNAGFDRRFLDTELQRIKLQRAQDFACSMLVARRVYPDAPGHSLKTLVMHKSLATTGVYHRALADAEMTGHLWIGMVNDLKVHFKLKFVPFNLMQRLAKVSKAAVPSFLKRVAAEQE